jgi:hypothetical protein
MQLSSIEYNVIMQAIDNAKNAIHADEFINYYDLENPDHWTNDNLLAALQRVENKIMSDNVPY